MGSSRSELLGIQRILLVTQFVERESELLLVGLPTGVFEAYAYHSGLQVQGVVIDFTVCSLTEVSTRTRSEIEAAVEITALRIVTQTTTL